MKFKPLNDRVLVKRVDAEETTKGGIIIPDNAKEKPMQGKVVAAGPGKMLDSGKLVALEVKVGQTVFFRKYAGSEMSIEGQEHLILREDEILAVLE
jgi:chaperonin GroES